MHSVKNSIGKSTDCLTRLKMGMGCSREKNFGLPSPKLLLNKCSYIAYFRSLKTPTPRYIVYNYTDL